MGKILSRFLLVLGFSLVLTDRCFAICGIGEYNYCELDDHYVTYCQCECIPCGNGQTSDGTGQINSCGSPTINESGCHYTNPNVPTYCKGYGECDISEWHNLGYKCKKFTCEDDGIVGYEVCVPTTGYTTPKFFVNVSNPDAPVEAAGHFEGDKCYSNTRSCSKFDVFINTGGGGAWTCKPEYQTGNAQWIDEGDGMWNVSACKCESDAVVADGCAVGVVKHNRDGSYIQKATDKIRYEQTHRYCKKCAAGKIPKKDPAETNGVKFRPDNPSGDYNWGVYRCENVSVPYYATGCTIDFAQSNFNNVVTGCRAQCSSQYLTITTNGATSADACKPDSTEYTDGIGKFTLGPDSCN